MCVGLPMQVVSAAGENSALCSYRSENHVIDTRLVADVEPGDWIMTHLGAAREKIDEASAANALAALEALDAIMSGKPVDIEAAFPDLVSREPRLPDHLLHQETHK